MQVSGLFWLSVGSVRAMRTLDLMEYATDAAAQAAYVSNALTATGGTITYDDNYTIHTFTANGTFTVNNSGEVEYLVVAGGGGGGGTNSASTSSGGSGGGAGGFRTATGFSVTAQAYSITVGGGGAGGVSLADGENGGNSVFDTITSLGGGSGGDAQNSTGGTGGSGGGGTAAGNGTAGQGNDGGTGSAGGSTGGGAGGGASAVGGNNSASTGGAGGVGTASSISGSSVYYSGGGGGGAGNGAPGVGGAGGNGGGGDGGNEVSNGEAGTANTGGGGGGGGYGSQINGGAGGSGIVIIKYLTSLQSYSEPTIKTQGSYSLKGVAAITSSLNETFTHTFSAINLSNVNTIKVDMRSTRTGANVKLGIYEDANMRSEKTPNIGTADKFQTDNWDISEVADGDKDAIDKILITVVNADAGNTFYIDNIRYR